MDSRSSVVLIMASFLLSLVSACGGSSPVADVVEDYGDVGVGHEGHTNLVGGIWHMPGNEDPDANCVGCHGDNLQGDTGPSCYTCHDNADHTSKRGGHYHKKGSSSSCKKCHGPGNSGGLGPACSKCHG